jgi:cell division protein FtsI/penicillin-binding protein 2
MLVEALQSEGRLGQIEGYNLAGKTGTAQIPTDFGYDENLTVASFIGWGPVEDPAFLIFVRIDKPLTSPWGSMIAAPVFQEVAQRLVVLLDIPPEFVYEEEEVTVQDGT